MLIPHKCDYNLTNKSFYFLKGNRISYSTSERGKLILIYNGFNFYEERRLADGKTIQWHCSQKKALKCRVKLSHELQTNKVKLNGKAHNHGVIEGRRKTGELKRQRMQRGLNPVYFKPKTQSKNKK
ncbi:hypothetical protein ACKWTF_011506 [Chironomus riparius]